VILEHLPLLLLPAAALTELQQMLPGSNNTKGASQSKADSLQQQGSWQELLPLVQDLALSLLWCGTQQQPWDSVQAALQVPLAAFFEQRNMRHCQQLLQQATAGTSDVAATAASAAAAAATTPRAVAAPAPAQVTRQQLQQHRQQHQQLQQQHQQLQQQQQQQQQQPPHEATAVSNSPREPAAAAAAAMDGGSSSSGLPPSSRFPAEFYLFTYKIAPCSVTGPHEWST
jgi:membrane protein insertase Oxa1/YidC/SpoIIIJ